MARNKSFDVDGLDKWQQGLLAMEGPALEKTKDRILRTTGLRVQEYLDDLTPVRSGRLKNSMSMGDPGNVFEMKVAVGGKSYVLTGTNVEYAEAVEDGFEQRKGRFVPGEWKSGTFHYKPGSKKGMVLTGKVIPGAHMFQKAMTYVEDDLKTVVDFEFMRMYKDIFG